MWDLPRPGLKPVSPALAGGFLTTVPPGKSLHNGILAMKKNEILPFATIWMDLEGIMLSEISHTERQIMCDFAYMWNLKNNWTATCKRTKLD